MRFTLLLSLLLLLATAMLIGQEESRFLRDSMYCDQGITGTQEFERQTRIYFPAYDEQGRVLQQISEKNEAGMWMPQSRRMFAYEGEEISMMHIQVWNTFMNNWLDQRKDLFTYQDELLKEHIRQKAPQGQLLVNDRRWSYEHNSEGDETLVLLEQWNTDAWESLSRKIQTYYQNGELETQTLQVWMGGNWRNVRSRVWEYEQSGNRNRVKVTTVRNWSANNDEWENRSRKLFFYNDDGIWIGSRFEDWAPGNQGMGEYRQDDL